MSDQLKPDASRLESLRPILLIGRIGRAHGLFGEVRVFNLSSNPDRFDNLGTCLLVSDDEEPIRDVELEKVRKAPDHLVVKLKGLDDRTAVEKLTGCFLAVRRDQAIHLTEDEWFVCDLVGCSVHDRARGLLGKVVNIVQNGAQDVYVVRLAGEKDLMFPAVKSILKKVDIQQGRIDVDLPTGLFEIYRKGD